METTGSSSLPQSSGPLTSPRLRPNSSQAGSMLLSSPALSLRLRYYVAPLKIQIQLHRQSLTFPAMSKAISTNGFDSARHRPSERVLTLDTINPNVLKAEYAVRGEIAIRAEELREQCTSEDGRKKLGFDKVISCNIGNPQQLDQKPITFFRQVCGVTLAFVLSFS